MRRILHVMTVLLGASALLIAGCGAKPIAATPQEAVANLVRATETGDEKLYLQTVYAGEGNEDFVRALLPYERAMLELVRAFAETYGEAEAAKFSMVAARPSFFLAGTAKVHVEQEPAKAVAQVRGMPGEVPLLRKGAYWMVDARSVLFRKSTPTTAEERKAFLEVLQYYTTGAKRAKESYLTPADPERKARDVLRDIELTILHHRSN